MAFDYAGAKAAGYSDQEINAYLAQKAAGAQLPQSPIPQVTTPAPQQASDLISQLGQGGINLLKLIAPRITNAIQDVGESARVNSEVLPQQQQQFQNLQQSTALAKQALKETDPNKRAALLAQSRNIDANNSNQAQLNFSPDVQKSALERGVKIGLEGGSFLVPFGGGSNLVTKAIAPGALTGLLQGLSQDKVTPQSVVGNTIAGGATAGLLQGLFGLAGAGAKATGAGLDTASNKILRAQYNVTPKVAEKLNLGNAVDQLAGYGVKNINDVAKAAGIVTGDTGVITKLTRQAVEKSSTVDTGGVLKAAQQYLDNEPLINQSVGKKFMDVVRKGISSPEGITGGDPGQVFDFIKELESKAVSLKGRTPESQALANAYSGVANELKDRLFTGVDASGQKVAGAGADSILANNLVKPEDLQALSKISPQLAESVAGAKTVGDLRSIAAPFVRGSQAAEKTASRNANAILTQRDALSGILGGLVGYPTLGAIGGPAGAVGGFAVSKALESNAGKTALSNLLEKAGQVSSGIGGAQINNPLLKTALGQAEARAPQLISTALSNKGNNTDNSGYQTPDNKPTNNLSNHPIMITDYNNYVNGANDPNRITRDMVSQAYVKFPKVVADRINDAFNAQQGNADMQKKERAKEYANTIINTLEQQYNQGQFASGRVGGPLQDLLAKAGFNAKLNNYNASRDSVKPLIARAFGDVGNLTKAEQEQAIKLLPTANSTKEEAALNFAQLRALLGVAPSQ